MKSQKNAHITHIIALNHFANSLELGLILTQLCNPTTQDPQANTQASCHPVVSFYSRIIFELIDKITLFDHCMFDCVTKMLIR